MCKTLQDIIADITLPEGAVPPNAKTILREKITEHFQRRGLEFAQKFKEKVVALIEASNRDIPTIGPKTVYCLSKDSEAALQKSRNVALILRRLKLIICSASELKLSTLNARPQNHFFGQILMQLSKAETPFAQIAFICTGLPKSNLRDIVAFTKIFNPENLKAFCDKGVGFPLDLSRLLFIFTSSPEEAKPYIERLGGAIFEIKPSPPDGGDPSEDVAESSFDPTNIRLTPKLYNFQAPSEFVDELYQICFTPALLETLSGLEPNKIAAKFQISLSKTTRFSNWHIVIISTPHVFSNPTMFIQFNIFEGCFMLFHELPKPELSLHENQIKNIISVPESFGKIKSNGRTLIDVFKSALENHCNMLHPTFTDFEEGLNKVFYGSEKTQHRIAISFCHLNINEKLEVQYGPGMHDKITLTLRQSTYSTDLCRSPETDEAMAEKLRLTAEEAAEPLKTAILAVSQMMEDGKDFDYIRKNIDVIVKDFSPEIFENFGSVKFGVLTYLPKRGGNLSYIGTEKARECVIGDLGVVVFMT